MLISDVHGQRRRDTTTMKKSEHEQTAAVLKALTNGWALVDSDPDIDFLVFVSEDSDELAFYPKKSFVQLMERSGLIENLDKEGSSARYPHTYYEGDGSVWKEITEAGSIGFQYRVTPKGRIFLRDAPKLIGKPVEPLRVAASPIEIPSKPLKVVSYDREAVQKLVDAFVQKATAQIEGLFSSEDNVDPSLSTRRLMCGPKLWRKLESQAWLNGLRPTGMLVQRTFSLTHGKEKSQDRLLDDQPLFAAEEVRLFRKTLRETFKLDGPPLIRYAKAAEASVYPYPEQIRNNDFPPPDLSSLAILFVVEINQSRFAVLVTSEPDADLKHFGPEISWVDLMQDLGKQE
jgi:hypothetical protein